MWLFALPAVLINVVIILIPALLTFAAAFVVWDGVGVPVWAGFANFQRMSDDPVFWSSLGNNLVWTLIFLTVPVIMALVMAAALLVAPKGRLFVQCVIFLPRILAVAVIGRIFQGMIFSPVTGVVAWLNERGFSIDDPLADPDRSLYAVAAVDIWHWWGFLAVVFLAAMRQISIDQIEAARLDGAGFFTLMRYVLLPGIQPTLALMMILTVIWSFQVFEFIYIVTRGGPAYGSEVLATLAYRHAFFEGDIGQAAAVSCATRLQWENFASAWRNASLGSSLLHSAEVAGLTILMVCLTAAPCAYVLARQQGRGWRFLGFYFMASITVPAQLYLFPLYFLFAKLGLVNSIPAVALIYTAMFSPFAIFLLRTYVIAIPKALEEAAQVDGAKPWQTFLYVILPMMRPGLLTVAIIVGLNAWNEFVIAVTFLQNDNNVTAIVKFYSLTGQYSTDWGEMLAAAIIIVLPVVVVFVLLQRRFIEGMTAGAVKS